MNLFETTSIFIRIFSTFFVVVSLMYFALVDSGSSRSTAALGRLLHSLIQAIQLSMITVYQCVYMAAAGALALVEFELLNFNSDFCIFFKKYAQKPTF